MPGLGQSRMPSWLGAIQVQLSNTSLYDSVVNSLMLVATFWFTSGYPMTQRYAPWFQMWMLFAFFVIYKSAAMWVDYKFMLPSRMAFNNTQSCKVENPAMEALRDLQADMKLIKEKLEITK